ncbi:hypothetical protein TNCV_1244811 [Trichonephila clavipes]|nr:hypothetical protein TNCV_1244811 [Trichonephila clavipes]
MGMCLCPRIMFHPFEVTQTPEQHATVNEMKNNLMFHARLVSFDPRTVLRQCNGGSTPPQSAREPHHHGHHGGGSIFDDAASLANGAADTLTGGLL